MRSSAQVLLSLWGVCASVPALAEDLSQRQVYAGVYLHDVSRFDQKGGVFDVDVELWAKWRGELDREQIRLSNAAEVETQFLGETQDGDWHAARWRIRGTLRGEFPLKQFPFDVQVLPVVVELPQQLGKLQPDLAASGMAGKFSLTDWLYQPEFRPTVYSAAFNSDLGNLVNEGRSTTVNRVAFQLFMTRPILPVLLKLFLPLGLIALVALVALFLHPDQIDARAAMGVTALLSCFAFQFTVADSLPAVAYLTLADVLFLIGYLVSAVVIATTILTFALVRGGKVQLAQWIDRVVLVVLPGAVAAAVILAVPEVSPVPRSGPDPIPQMTRTPSSRDTLRIGTTGLTQIPGSPLSIASAWSLVEADAEGTVFPVYAERAPGVANDALRFLAEGRIEVSWRIREGMKWSDGAPLTSEDLAFALEAIPDEDLAEAKVVDERTLVLTWKYPLAKALEPPSVLPGHVLRPLFAAGGYEAVKKHRASHPIPTLGPYRVTSFQAKEGMTAEANPHFNGPPPSIAKLELKYFAEREALMAAFENGEVDLVAPNSITLEQAQAMAARKVPGVIIRPSAVYVSLTPDLTHPLLSKREVREALLMSIDRAAIAQAVYGTPQAVAHLPLPGALPKAARTVPFRPAVAKAALKRYGVAGKELTLLHSDSPVDGKMVSLLEKQLRAVGVKLVRKQVKNTLSTAREGGHGGLVLNAIRAARDSDPRRYWNLPLRKGQYDHSARNDAYTESIHAWAERETRALYPERRAQLRELLLSLTSQHLPELPLLFATERVLAHPQLKGWDGGAETSFGTGLERWYFEASQPTAEADATAGQ